MAFRITLSLIFLFNQVTWAGEPTQSEKVQEFLKPFSNIQTVLDYLKSSFPKAEVQEFENYLVSKGLNLKEKFPTAKVVGNKVLVGEDSFEFMDDAILFYGLKVKYNPKISLKLNYEILSKSTKSVSLFYLFVPQANAFWEKIIAIFGLLVLIDISQSKSKTSDGVTVKCDEFGRFVFNLHKEQKVVATRLIPDGEVKQRLNVNFRPKCVKGEHDVLEIQEQFRNEIKVQEPPRIEGNAKK